MDLTAYAKFDPGGHIALRSFKRDGTPVDTPLWFVSLNGKYYARTFAGSAKTRRLNHNASVELADCTFDGRINGAWRTARAVLLDDGGESKALIQKVDQLADDKYGAERKAMTAQMKEWQASPAWIEIEEIQ